MYVRRLSCFCGVCHDAITRLPKLLLATIIVNIKKTKLLK
jgi:hypothetical protein